MGELSTVQTRQEVIREIQKYLKHAKIYFVDAVRLSLGYLIEEEQKICNNEEFKERLQIVYSHLRSGSLQGSKRQKKDFLVLELCTPEVFRTYDKLKSDYNEVADRLKLISRGGVGLIHLALNEQLQQISNEMERLEVVDVYDIALIDLFTLLEKIDEVYPKVTPKKAEEDWQEQYQKQVEENKTLREQLNESQANCNRQTLEKSLNEKPMHPKEKITFLKMIAAMATDSYGYNPFDKKSTVTTDIKDALDKIECTLDEDTIRDKLHQASEYIPGYFYNK